MREGRTTRRLTNAKKVGLPVRPFLFTLDQVAGLLKVTQEELESDYIHFWGRSVGRLLANGDRMKAVNIAPKNQAPNWRVSEEDLLRWCLAHDIVVYH